MIQKIQFYTRHSLNDLRVNRQRTLFALLCIAAGVAAIVSLQTLGVMIDDTLTGSLQESNRGDIRILPYQPFEEDGGGEQDQTKRDALNKQGVDEGVINDGGAFSESFVTAQGIQDITDWFQQNYPGTEITYRQVVNSFSSGMSISIPDKDTNKTFVTPFVVDAQVYPFYGERKSEDGTPLRDLIQSPTDIVISRNLADDLDAKVGDTVSLSGASKDFVLRGIVPTDEEGGFENFLGALFGYYFIDYSAINLFSDIDPGANTIYVKLADPSQAEAVTKAFATRFPYLDTVSTKDLEEQNSEVSDVVNQLVIVMGLVSLLIGGIGIVNTMLVIVSRRTTEVAVLKTIGLEGEQVTILFLIEAVLMGILGSLLGIVLGWIAAYAIKGVAEGFLAQSLTFRITPMPAITGFVVGVVVTAVFGFIPTLAAGQVRPNLVLRPSETVIPKAGRARSFAALLFVMVALSLVAQVLIHSLLDSDTLRQAAQGTGAFLGLVLGLTMLSGGLLATWVRRNILLRIVRWLLLIPGLPILGSLFGYAVPAILILFSTFIIVGILYVVLWVLIWSFGGGELRELWLLPWKTVRTFRRNLPKSSSALVRNPVVRAVMGLGAVIGTILVWVLNSVLIVAMIPFWLLGRLIQRLAMVDLRLSMRSMLAAKGRNASTLLALVIGVFTLSLITMLADAITKRFEEIMVNEVGGNVIIFAAGTDNTVGKVTERLDGFAQTGDVKSYSVLSIYQTQLVSATHVSTGKTYTLEDLEAQAETSNSDYGTDISWLFDSTDGRGVDSNLPDVDFYAGRQLTQADTGPWDPEAGDYPPIVISANEGIVNTVLDVGDLLTFKLTGSNGPTGAGQGETRTITFKIVGMIDRTGSQISVNFGSQNYAPIEAFPKDLSPDQISAIVDVKEGKIPEVRRSLNELPGVFVLETKLLNDLINRMIDQFTSFPILVAALALVVGGIVIANSVALSTLERRREIAIMKAVGLQRERVLGMLLLEYGLMGLIGGLIGVGIGGIGLLLMLTQAFGGALGKSIPYMTAFSLMSLCVLIALVAAVVTAWGASGERPLNVLRYE
jgi:ABC-type antimicrobial peptide transport system permease subunit